MAKHNKKRAKQKLTKAERKEKYTKQARDRREKATFRKNNASKICFNCRQKGHTVADCPQSKNDGEKKKSPVVCYKCGLSDHALKDCKHLSKEEKDLMKKGGRINYTAMELPFAECFICKEIGHLSSQCEKNENGLYVKGGCCKQCGSKKHLYKFCPELEKKENIEKESVGDVEEFLEDEHSSENNENIE
jgi:Arginine methyltransferase-interacting protein, contains RING Zn-finger